MSVLKVETSSGATYYYDPDGQRVMRAGPHSPGINYGVAPDDEWHPVTLYREPEPEVGERWRLVLGDGLFRVTTKVVSIEEV